MAASGSTAVTRANRVASTRVTLPVPAPMSSTSDSGGRPPTSATAYGQPGRPRS